MCTLFDLTTHFNNAFATDFTSLYQQSQRYPDTTNYHTVQLAAQSGHQLPSASIPVPQYAGSISSSPTWSQLTERSVTVTSQSKPKRSRRRIATVPQRRAANIRERHRMEKLNTAFDKLRKRIPTFAYEKRLSRIDTLRLAIMYINFMRELLSSP